MKRRCVPLRGDHNLLTPDTHTLSGVRQCPVIQVRLASHSGHQSDLSSSKSTVGSTRQHPVASPTRRLRFEDETETEAESRYQERQQQRRWAGQQRTGVLVSRLNLYVSGRAGPPVPDDRGRSLCPPHVNLRTEPIRETYIGSVTPQSKSPWGGGGAEHVCNVQMRSRTSQGTPTTDLPVNPYAPDQLSTPAFICPSPASPPLVSVRLNCSEEEQDLMHDQDTRGRPEGVELHKQVRSGVELRDRSPCVDVEEGGGIQRMKNSSSSSSTSSFETSSDATAESPAPPIPESSSDGQVNHPIRTKLYTSRPEQFSSRDERSRLSLRHLLSSVRLNRTRTGSLDRHSIRPRPSALDPAPSSLLRKCPSSQSQSEQGSPFFQLRKVLSFQNVVSEQKKRDRSTDYRPAADT
ncbi:uncharacterized protein [Paralichthys olivaceus]|uniref:uncharacterized protein isoform X2 n=1 Tax=Paralichthys olivaceus TaxID=8255 RepID=UPI0037519D8A